jgi:endonuclease/exonuclease/phosphatase family metal-dependent hydrolase
MKIIFINFQSGMKMIQGHRQYFTSGWKYLFPHNSIALKDVVDFVNREKPDIVSFAEIDGVSWRSKGLNQIKEISNATHLEHSDFFVTRVQGNWIQQGNAVLSRYPILNTKQIKLPGRGERRYLCNANIDVESHILKFYTTHLSTSKQRNKMQRQFIAKKMNSIKTPAILTGDFNIGAEEMKIIKSQTCLRDIKFEPMFPSWKPNIILDHIFVSKECKVIKNTTYKDAIFSDHLPIGIECELQE